MKLELRKLSTEEGRKLWVKGFGDACQYPPRTTKWFEVVGAKGSILGWCAYRYLPKNTGRELAVLVTEGIFVSPAFRGNGLQNLIRDAMVASVRAPKSRRKIRVQTYALASNIPSIRNLTKWGMVPYKTFAEGESTFIHLEKIV